jgi:hypothetical protein
MTNANDVQWETWSANTRSMTPSAADNFDILTSILARKICQVPSCVPNFQSNRLPKLQRPRQLFQIAELLKTPSYRRQLPFYRMVYQNMSLSINRNEYYGQTFYPGFGKHFPLTPNMPRRNGRWLRCKLYVCLTI